MRFPPSPSTSSPPTSQSRWDSYNYEAYTLASPPVLSSFEKDDPGSTSSAMFFLHVCHTWYSVVPAVEALVSRSYHRADPTRVAHPPGTCRSRQPPPSSSSSHSSVHPAFQDQRPLPLILSSTGTPHQWDTHRTCFSNTVITSGWTRSQWSTLSHSIRARGGSAARCSAVGAGGAVAGGDLVADLPERDCEGGVGPKAERLVG
jgi:hypothetical protein